MKIYYITRANAHILRFNNLLRVITLDGFTIFSILTVNRGCRSNAVHNYHKIVGLQNVALFRFSIGSPTSIRSKRVGCQKCDNFS